MLETSKEVFNVESLRYNGRTLANGTRNVGVGVASRRLDILITLRVVGVTSLPQLCRHYDLRQGQSQGHRISACSVKWTILKRRKRHRLLLGRFTQS